MNLNKHPTIWEYAISIIINPTITSITLILISIKNLQLQKAMMYYLNQLSGDDVAVMVAVVCWRAHCASRDK